MQLPLQIFEYEGRREFRVFDRNGEPWFVLTDVCRELEIGNPSDAARRLDTDERDALDIIDPHGRSQKTNVINESGLYSLILTSRKEAAKRFKKWVTAEVLPSIRKTGSYGHNRAPAFIRRYNDNWDRVDAGYFSILNELVVHLWGRLEHAGHVMADRAPDGSENRPDVSVGRCFSDWLKSSHPEISQSFSYYVHKTPEWEGEVRQYPFAMLPLFREFLDQVWIPERAENYLRTRDPRALPYLPKLISSPDKPKAGMTRRVFIRRPRKAS